MGNRGDDFDIGIGMVLSFYFAMGFSPFFVSLMFSPSGLSSSSFFFFFLIIGILCAPIDFKISGKQGTLCFARGTQREFSATRLTVPPLRQVNSAFRVCLAE